jgi:Kef-type K+ transport system membrane component KefB
LKFWRIYFFFVAIPALGVVAVLRVGGRASVPVSSPSAGAAHAASMAPPAAGLPEVATLLLEIGAILLATRLVGALFRKIGQPQVIGEMAAGVILGPSLLGWVAPHFSLSLFPPSSLGSLGVLSQVGLVLYMFLVGLELDLGHMKGRGHVAVLTSHASILAPFFLGTLLALHFYRTLSGPGVRFATFALFLGAAMSVTAFPVLARILTDQGMHRTPLGSLSLTCAAVDDATAWCILAGVIVVAKVGQGSAPFWRTIVGSAAFVVFMVFVARPLLRRFGRLFASREAISKDMLAFLLLCAFASAWTAETIGIHALFGAFLAGTVMPREPGLARAVNQKIGDLSVVLLLPIFFAITGLRMNLRMLDGGGMWISTALVLLCALSGKLGGSALAARASGLPWREAAGVGILMNTRGLMELVILNVGLDIGVISPALFTMMVLMALVTTFMTTPLITRLYPNRAATSLGAENQAAS